MSQWTRAVASIDLAAIRSNVAEIVRRNPGAEVMAMVKADGYGHGATAVARAALEAGARWLGVAYASEALALRADGIGGRILVLVVNPGEDLDPVVAQGIDVSVSAPWALEAVVAAARRVGRQACVHLEVDTGMTRGGARPDGWPALVEAAKSAVAAGDITLNGIWTHLVHDDDPGHPMMDVQATAFEAAVEAARASGLTPAYSHISKSTTALARPDLGRDLVRAGLAVYGLSPTGVPDAGLTPAMTFKGAGRADRPRGGECRDRLQPSTPDGRTHGRRARAGGVCRRGCRVPEVESLRSWWEVGGGRSPARSAWTSSPSRLAETQ